jgi:hypothetical protein
MLAEAPEVLDPAWLEARRLFAPSPGFYNNPSLSPIAYDEQRRVLTCCAVDYFDTNATRRLTRLDPEYWYPRPLGLHVVPVVGDAVFCARRSDAVAWYPSHWAMGVSETLEPGDVSAVAAASRALKEELEVRVTDAANVEALDVLANTFQGFDVLCLYRMNALIDVVTDWESGEYHLIPFADILDGRAPGPWIPQTEAFAARLAEHVTSTH